MKKTLAFFAASALCCMHIYAQPGTPDSTFRGDGKVTTAVTNNDDFGAALALQPDGKIILAGESWNGSNYDFSVVRYNTNGKPDLSFSGDGKLTFSLLSDNDYATSVAVLPNGKILLAGYADIANKGSFALARLWPDGRLDSSFNGTGKRVYTFNTNDNMCYGMVVLQNGSIILSGVSKVNNNNSSIALLKVKANSNPDSSFGTNGLVITNVGSKSSANAVVVDANNKIVVAGFINFFEPGILRYKPNGTLDKTFGVNGVVRVRSGEISGGELKAVALQADGKIVACGGGYNNNDFSTAFVTTRVNTDGSLDNTFSGNATAKTFVEFYNKAYALQIQQDGKIVIGGLSNCNSCFFNYFTVARYNLNGSLDITFGTNGINETVFGTDDGFQDQICTAIALQPDGKIVAGGYATNTAQTKYNFAVARYLSASEAISSEAVSNISKQPASSIAIFPNPAKDLVNITGINAALTSTITIVNLSGKVMQRYTTKGSSYNINISSLTEGNYIAIISNNTQKVNLRFIKL